MKKTYLVYVHVKKMGNWIKWLEINIVLLFPYVKL